VVCVAQRHAPRALEHAPVPGLLPGIARYARGADYHQRFRRRLRKLARFIASWQPDAHARPLCDTAPVLERAWARRAGLGFIGKNGLLVAPGYGSFLTLGEIVTTVEILPDTPVPQRCGRCARCLQACPTGALVEPYVLDARRCISYWTIEHRGPWTSASPPLEGPWWFGCDRCQEVCPFNRAPAAYTACGSSFDPLPRWSRLQPVDLLLAPPEQVQTWTRGSPLRRATPLGLQRNVIALLRGTQDPTARAALDAVARDPCRPSWLRKLAVDATVPVGSGGAGGASAGTP
jgi:epoxyqueuosine reductase